jgi:hypothetical protein
MRRYAWILLLLLAVPVWAATKITVDQLKQTLASLQQAGKSDENVATQLKQIELTEELTHSVKQDLTKYLPGDLSTEQMFILQGRSAFLPPPVSNSSSASAPDEGTQKAILAKATDYVNKTYVEMPSVTATKTTARFQDDVINSSSSPGLTLPGPNSYARISDARTETVETEKGVEKATTKEKKSWGQNGQVSGPGPMPTLGVILQEASAGGKLSWERWQIVGGKQAAVFSFVVDKKKSHYDVSYCCFPKTETQSGIAAPGTFTPVPGEIQSLTTWKPFKKTVGYHGELFIDSESDAILRVITYAELKPTEYIHLEAVRVDFGPTVVDGKVYVLPLDSFTINEVVPGGDSNTIAYSVRHTLFNVTYTNYQLRK